jgi:hypothetical protein
MFSLVIEDAGGVRGGRELLPYQTHGKRARFP